MKTIEIPTGKDLIKVLDEIQANKLLGKYFTKTEKDTLLTVLSSCIDCFNDKDDVTGEYTDNGNFICSLPTKKHVNSLKTIYSKIFKL